MLLISPGEVGLCIIVNAWNWRFLFFRKVDVFKLKSKPIFSVQYHPESNPGPQDSVYLFEEFIKTMKQNAKKKRY